MLTGIVIGAFVGLVVVFVKMYKKDQQDQGDLVSGLTPEQKERIEAARPDFVEEKAFEQEAMVARVTDKGNKVDLRFLWFDTVTSNGEISIGDVSITKADQEAHNVQVGSFVKVYIAPEKTIGSVKVVF